MNFIGLRDPVLNFLNFLSSRVLISLKALSHNNHVVTFPPELGHKSERDVS